MSDIWRDGAFEADGWRRLGDDEALPSAGRVLLSSARLRAGRDALAAVEGPLGLVLEPADDLDDLAAELPRFALIAIAFPKFADGRGYSQARLLRERHGFTGELRAVGDILFDQIGFLLRAGFDTLEIVHAPTRRLLAEGRRPFQRHFTQPGLGAEAPVAGRGWLRRA